MNRREAKTGWLRCYRWHFVGVAAGYVVLLLLFWALGRVRADWANATIGYFAIANLIVLWWYADLTRTIADTAARQLRFQADEYRLSQRPVVFLDVQRVTGRERVVTAIRHVVGNVGPGLAVNVYVVRALLKPSPGKPPWTISSAGALSPGGEVEIDPREDPAAALYEEPMSGWLVLAEAMKTRTVRWTITANVRDNTGNIHHRFVELDTDDDLPLAKLLENRGDRFLHELEDLHEQVWKR